MNNQTHFYLKLKTIGIDTATNVSQMPVIIDEVNDTIAPYQSDPYTGKYPSIDNLYFFEKHNGSWKFQKFPEDLFDLAQAFRSILREHFGENAETDQTITKQYVTKYFLQRQVSRTATQFDSGDAQLLNEGFNKISEWTRDGTTWTFPWYILD